MVYLDSKKDPQEVWIPRNDGNGSTHSGSSHSYQEGYADGVNDQKAKLASTAFTENGDYQRNDGWSAVTVNVPQSGSVLEGKEIVVSQDVTIVVPTSGYDGFSAVTIDATEYGQTNYDSGFDDGFTDGYSSGSSEGFDSGYTEGYQSGSTDGFNSGYTSGETHQKSLLISTAITQNGSYSRENGYSAITVNVPQTGSTSVLGVGSFSANGTYSASTDSLDGYSAITVNVPQTTYTIEDTKEVNVSFTNTPIVVTPTKNNIQVTEIITNKKFSLDASSFSGINYNLYLGCFRDVSINDRYAGNSVIYDGHNFNVDTKYSDYPFTATTEGGGTILTIEFLYPTFEWIGNGDGSEYDLLSATTICFKPDVSARDVFVDMSSYVQSVYAVNYGLDYLKGVVVSCENLVNSARTEAQNAIISTFTAATATTNGVYGSSAHPLSSITVNVPTTVNPNIIAERNFSFSNPTINTTNIQEFAFEGANLTGVLTIGSAVTNIYAYAFRYAPITAITFPQTIVGNEYGKMVMAGYGQFTYTNIVTLDVPNYLEFTENGSTSNTTGIFESCTALTTVNWKAYRVPKYTFRYCSSLSAITLVDVEYIDRSAFTNCSSLTQINCSSTIAPTITNANAFQGVPSTGTVHYPQGSDYSSWQSNTYLSGWTFVADL